MGRTLAEKILAAHVASVRARGAAATPGTSEAKPVVGDVVRVNADTVAVSEDDLATALPPHPLPSVLDPARLVVVSSGLSPRSTEDRRRRVRAQVRAHVRAFTKRHEVVQHVPASRGGALLVDLPDRGRAVPGSLVISSDRRAAAWGVLGCFGVPVGVPDLSDTLASGEVTVTVPPTLKVRVDGQPGRWVCGKDLGLLALTRLVPEQIQGRAIELSGRAISDFDVHDRLSLASVLAEADAAAVFCELDEKALAWLRARAGGGVSPILPDRTAQYEDVVTLDVDGAGPMVALPGAVTNGTPVSEIPETKLDRVILGGADGGRIEDLRLVARLLREHSVCADLDLVVVPGTQRILLHAIEEGLVSLLLRSGAAIAPPGGTLWEGPNPGIAEPGERCLMTAGPNQPGCQGIDDAEVLLAGPAVAAASAVFGRVAHPDEVLRRQRETV